MEVRINEVIFDIPFDPAVIPLSKFIIWHNDYGKDLNKELIAIIDNKHIDELDKTFQLENYLDKEALHWFCFWTDTEFVEASTHPSILPYLQQYRVLRYMLKENDYDYPYQVDWKNEQWEIQDFKLNPSAEMNFNEIITSKEVMRQVYKIGGDNWNGIPYLCCIFFRKKGELFDDKFIADGSPRMRELQEVPLVHAMAVAFFLNICVNIWNKSLASSVEEKEAVAANRR